MHRYALVSVAVLAMLFGRVTDRTTGQPLSGVHVSVTGPSRAAAVTDSQGRYRASGLRPGTYHLTFQSHDVPAQHRTVTMGKRNVQLDVTACSTTLDYSCVNPMNPGGGPG